ncbi:MFS transporter [Elizabethkingia meningoseptica]|uniref:MFS transporter n=1 Tax=Elizabethkingia meningoseptica TaxID=238 RepID=UPI002DD6617B|nr:MFS transporter [Elizabethkingia meningoseptica]MEC4713195.1 MFS transporter [Elizabethkingia meningoseptica]
MYNKGLFANWVPKPVQLLLIVIMAAYTMSLSGVNTGNITYMYSDMGSMTEYFSMANYATTIGMGAVMPLVMRFKFRFKVRDKLTFGFVVVAALSLLNATTNQPELIVVSSFLVGFMKMFIMIEFFLPLMMILSPDGNRGKFYSVFYPFAIIISQIVNYISVDISFRYNWEHFYILTASGALLMAVLCWIFMHNQYFSIKMPLYYIDWMSVVLFSATFMFSCYVFSFGKQQDWLNSPKIINASIAAFVSFVLLAFRQTTLKRPYLSFKIFKRKNVYSGLLMLLMLGMFLATGTIQNVFAVSILGYDMVTNAELSLWMIPGMLISGIAGSFWFRKGWNIKFYVLTGFSTLVAYCIIMYFSMVPEMNYYRWYLPMILKGYGMCTLYITIWFYMMDKLDIDDMMAAIGLALVWRSFIAVAVFSALFSWFQYDFQVVSLGDMAVYLDGINLSQPTAMQNLKSFQIHAILAANKKLFGYIIIAGFGAILFVLQHSFGRERFTSYKRYVRLIKGRELIAQRRRREQLILEKGAEDIKDAAGSAF